MQRFAEAEAVYTGLEQAFPGDAAIMNGKAVLLNRTGRTDAAINLWHNLQTRHPDMSATFTINIGLAQPASGQVVEAIARFEAALAAQHGLFAAHFNLRATLLAAGLPAPAIPHLADSAATRPRHAPTPPLPCPDHPHAPNG